MLRSEQGERVLELALFDQIRRPTVRHRLGSVLPSRLGHTLAQPHNDFGASAEVIRRWPSSLPRCVSTRRGWRMSPELVQRQDLCDAVQQHAATPGGVSIQAYPR